MDKELFLKHELSQFLHDHSAGTSISSIDEIVLNYMLSILEELGTDTAAEDAFDVEQFVEMMEAYLPGFGAIDSISVCEWMFSLSHKLVQLGKQDEACGSPVNLRLPVLAGLPPEKGNKDPPKSKGSRSRKKSTSKDDISEPYRAEECSNGHSEEFEEEEDEDVKMLCEMFPSAVSIEISHCLCVANGNLENAAQLLLYRQETGEAITESHKRRQGAAPIQKDTNMKKHIINKYAYVDVDEDKIEHKPIAPKTQPKKLVRYRDSQVVNTKGEKFTEMKKNDDPDKKTYVNLKPARQYRFH